MYGLPGSRIQFGTLPARRKPGRRSALAKFLEQQRDLFPVDLFISKLAAASAPARSEARTDALPDASGRAKNEAGHEVPVFDLRRGSTADQSRLRDLER